MRIFNGSIYISPRGNMDNNDVNAKGCSIYSFEEEQTKKEKRTNLLLNSLFSRKAMIPLLGILYVILLNVLVSNKNDNMAVPFSNSCSRNLSEKNPLNVDMKYVKSKCCDSISESNMHDRLKVQMLLKNAFETEDGNVFGQNDDVFKDLLCDDMWTRYHLNLHDKCDIKNGKHEMDHMMNEELFKLCEVDDNREKMMNFWKETFENEKKKYNQIIYDLYMYLDFLRRKHKVPREYASKQWDDCVRKVKETEENAKVLLEDIFDFWLENEDLDKNEFIALISGCRLLWRKLSDDMAKACKVYMSKPFNDVYNEKKKILKRGMDLSDVNYDDHFKSGKFLKHYSTNENTYPTLQTLLEKYAITDDYSPPDVFGKSYPPLHEEMSSFQSSSVETKDEENENFDNNEKNVSEKSNSLSHNKDQHHDETYNEQYELYLKEIESKVEKLAENQVEKEFQEVNERFNEVGKRIKLTEKTVNFQEIDNESQDDSDEQEDEEDVEDNNDDENNDEVSSN
ncbi:exported protein (PHISTb) [Plasmodium reichenowi]|uniref:Exported protein (PHISTb) n=1 Tax=Plasmodium reichenowi TaxID=5854 RepID=A0A151LRE6_PLARE|nr:exported protein (PHISTb) [Plasmodium reichenowi]KYO01709.1 exported protein (PHISTb) [Plasmodium reichenowi]